MIFKLNGMTFGIVDKFPEKGMRKDYLEQFARVKFPGVLDLIEVEEIDLINTDESHVVDFKGSPKTEEPGKDWLK